MQSTNSKVVTRMAPSPTGNFHIGGVRTALYNYLYSRQNKGTFILRSEDTDTERSKKEFEDDIFAIFDWLSLDYDEFYRQSDRTAIYQEHIHKLIENNHAYEAEASNDFPEKSVIRFKNPNTVIEFEDLILGSIKFDTTELGDFVIARTIDTPIYHLTVVIDDGLSGVTHVIRGQEHINNTARQILILEALGFTRPNYAHIPLIMSPRGGKLSKRDPEVVPVLGYRDQGILPDALLNFLAFIGWNPGDDREIMSISEMIESFDLGKVQKSGGTFNVEKLHWVNKQYLQKLSDEEYVTYLGNRYEKIKALEGYQDEIFEKIIPQLRERTETLVDVDTMIDSGEVEYYFKAPEYDVEKAIWKEDNRDLTKQYLEHLINLIEEYTGEWESGKLKEAIFPFAEEKGKGSVLWPLRYSLSGRDKSPDPFSLLEILGKQESIQRITKAVKML
jgi:glutamyl-tRNA synthetase